MNAFHGSSLWRHGVSGVNCWEAAGGKDGNGGSCRRRWGNHISMTGWTTLSLYLSRLIHLACAPLYQSVLTPNPLTREPCGWWWGEGAKPTGINNLVLSRMKGFKDTLVKRNESRSQGDNFPKNERYNKNWTEFLIPHLFFLQNDIICSRVTIIRVNWIINASKIEEVSFNYKDTSGLVWRQNKRFSRTVRRLD